MHDDIDVRRVRRIGIVALLVFAAVVAAAMLLTSRWDNDLAPATAGLPSGWIAGPVLETHPQADMAQYLAAKQAGIDGYAWVDRQAGIARIPLDVAMRAMAEGARP